MTDSQLLERYAKSNDQEALGTLIGRYIGMVHAAALRQTQDLHTSEDITQGVFLALLRKARVLRPQASIAPWLLRATWLACKYERRTERRRLHHETRATRERSPVPDDAWLSVEPVLDAAIHRLRDGERNAVVLRFFAGASFREVGQKLGISEEAARKRVNRAVDNLRRLLPVQVTAPGLVLLLDQHSTDSNAGELLPAVLSSATHPTPAASAIASSVLRTLTGLHLRVAAAIGGVCLVAAVLAAATTSPVSEQSQVASSAPAAVIAPEIPDPLTLPAIEQRILAARRQVQRLHYRSTMRMETLPLENEQWQASPVMRDAEIWIEFAPVARLRVSAEHIAPWTAGKAPYIAERYIATWSGETGVWRSLATAHHDGTALQPWFTFGEERPIESRSMWSYTPDLTLAPHLSPVREFSLYGLIRSAIERPANDEWIRASVEQVPHDGLVHIRFELPGAQHDYWLDPAHGWTCARSAVRSGRVLEEIEVTAFTGAGSAWFPSGGVRVLRGVDETARARRYHFTTTDVRVNPPPFEDALFKP